MISKERLEELIKNGVGNIYEICNRKVIEINIEKYFACSEQDGVILLHNKSYNYPTFLNFLYETEEDAKWELEMTATRTETLKLPTWEEFIQSDKQVIFYDKDKTYYIDKVMDKTHIIIGYKCIIDLIEELEANRYNFYRKPATKENYIEACKLCLRLFKGEEV